MLTIHQLTSDFAAGQQIDPADMAELKALGFAHVVNNRPDGEVPPALRDAEMRAAALAAGLEYSAIPVGAAGIGEHEITAMRAVLDSSAGPVFGWCRSGMRSAYLWAFARASSGADAEQLIAEAAAAGYDLAAVRTALEALSAQAAAGR